MHYTISLGVAKKLLFFIKKKYSMQGWGCGRDTEPVGDGDEVQLLIPIGMGWITSKYMRIKYRDGKFKICPHPTPLSCLITMVS